MAFSFGATKPNTGFALPTTSSNTGFQFGGAGGDAKSTSTSITLTFAPASTAVNTASTTSAPLSFGLTNTTSTPQFSLGGTTNVTTTSSSLPFSLTTTTAPSLLNVSTPSVSTSSTAITSSVFSLSSKPTSSTTTTGSTASTSVSISTATTITPSITSGLGTALGSVSALTFSQLEDNINKWTIHLEDEGKHYSNQAKQVNAWDHVLITNGEKILYLSNGVERVKQQQEQLDQELDFVLAQQKELEDLIVPLEKELADIPVTDLDRHRTYQMAETLDTQLKQMSEDLKEIIEHLNESNRIQELANPIIQIGRILNVHMNSLKWIDRNTTKITTHLDQIAKMHDMNKRNHEINLHKTYE